ncbi:MAG: hypothetical protein AB8I58_16440, partial [Anaerolineales bacterium]
SQNQTGDDHQRKNNFPNSFSSHRNYLHKTRFSDNYSATLEGDDHWLSSYVFGCVMYIVPKTCEEIMKGPGICGEGLRDLFRCFEK